MSPPLGQHPWLEAYATPTTVPGAGGAAAVAGALGCALLAMAARVAARKAADSREADRLERLGAEADRLRAAFLAAEAADADAQEAMLAAGRVARAVAPDPGAAAAAEQAVIEAVRVPLATAELAGRGLRLAADLAQAALARTASDQVTAVHLLLAALEGGLAVSAANLGAVGQTQVRQELAGRAAELAGARQTAQATASRLGPPLA